MAGWEWLFGSGTPEDIEWRKRLGSQLSNAGASVSKANREGASIWGSIAAGGKGFAEGGESADKTALQQAQAQSALATARKSEIEARRKMGAQPGQYFKGPDGLAWEFDSSGEPKRLEKWLQEGLDVSKLPPLPLPGAPLNPSQQTLAGNIPRLRDPSDIQRLGLKSGDKFYDDQGVLRVVP